MANETDKQGNKKVYMQLFKGLIDQAFSASTDVMLQGGEKLLDDQAVAKCIEDKKILPYIYLTGLLNMLGRDINSENMSKVLTGMGMNPDQKLIDVILKADNENGVIYVYSIYFLVILGRERNRKNVMDLVNSLGIKANPTFAKNALNFYNKKYGEK